MMSIVIAAPPFSSSGTDTLRLRIVAPQEGAKFCRSKTGERPHQRDPRQGGLANVRHSVIILGGTVEAFIEIVSTTPTLSQTYSFAARDAQVSVGPA
jgi:hypothetical protein